jgi:hypothetical protein
MPDGVVTHLEARLLRQIVNSAIHPIRCAASCKRKFQKGMQIGDLCAETGHFRWAMKVWKLTESLIEAKDWNDWLYVWFNSEWVRFTDVISETECELLSKRRSDLWKALGFPDVAWWDADRERLSESFGSYYRDLWYEKFDYDPVEWDLEYEAAIEELTAQQEADRIFREGNCELF